MSAKRALIADYERAVRESLGLVFAQHGCDCRTVEKAEEAVSTAAEWVPDVVVLDLLLMNINGVECAQILQERCPAAVILLLASTGASPLWREAEQLGFRVFQKPVGPTVLLEAAGIL